MVHYYGATIYFLYSYLYSNVLPARCSRVESKHTLVVASNEQGGWKVLCQNVQPGHVEEIRDRFLTSDGHAPAGSRKFKEYVRHCFFPQWIKLGSSMVVILTQ